MRLITRAAKPVWRTPCTTVEEELARSAPDDPRLKRVGAHVRQTHCRSGSTPFPWGLSQKPPTSGVPEMGEGDWRRGQIAARLLQDGRGSFLSSSRSGAWRRPFRAGMVWWARISPPTRLNSAASPRSAGGEAVPSRDSCAAKSFCPRRTGPPRSILTLCPTRAIAAWALRAGKTGTKANCFKCSPSALLTAAAGRCAPRRPNRLKPCGQWDLNPPQFHRDRRGGLGLVPENAARPPTLPYWIDGIVVKLDSIAEQLPWRDRPAPERPGRAQV